MDVIEITTKKNFIKLEPIWDNLLKKSNNNLPFLNFSWQKNYWQYFNNNKRLFVLLIKDNNEIVGICPFYISLLTKQIKFIGTGISDYLNFIFEKDKEEKCLLTLFDYLTENLRRFNLINLQQINDNYYKIFSVNNHLLIEQLIQDIASYILLPNDYEDYLKSIGRKTRQNLRYYERLINKKFNVRFEMLNDSKLIDNVMDRLFYLHKRRWQKKLLPGMFYTKKIRLFHKNIANEFFNKDMLSVYYLLLNDKIESIIYGFKLNKKFYYYLGGFNPQLSKYSIGTVLINLIIKDLINKGYKEFDFLRGQEHYKYRFGAQDRENFQILIYKNTFQSKIITKWIITQQVFINKLKKRLN